MEGIYHFLSEGLTQGSALSLLSLPYHARLLITAFKCNFTETSLEIYGGTKFAPRGLFTACTLKPVLCVYINEGNMIMTVQESMPKSFDCR